MSFIFPLEERVKIVLADYEPWNNPERFKEAFQLIEKRLHTPIAKQIETHLENGEFALVVELLLEHYYDPRYKHSGDQNTELQKVDIEAKNVEDAFQKVLQTIERIKTLLFIMKMNCLNNRPYCRLFRQFFIVDGLDIKESSLKFT